MFIEMALDSLKDQVRNVQSINHKTDTWILNREIQEFNEFGDGRAGELLDAVCKVAPSGAVSLNIKGASIDMLAGYLLGIETARAMLSTSVKAVNAEVMI